MLVFPSEKPWFPRFDTFIFSCFFDDFSIIFRHRILYRFFHDFGCHFGSIFHPFSTLWPSFWHTFSVSIFWWFLDAILDDFWSKIYNPNSNPERHFFYFFLVFSGTRSRDGFWMNFDGFLLDFGWIFINFGIHFRASGFFFRPFWIHFAQLRVVIFSFSATSMV